MKYLNRINGKVYEAVRFGPAKVVIKNNGTVRVSYKYNKFLYQNFLTLHDLDLALINGEVIGYVEEEEEFREIMED